MDDQLTSTAVLDDLGDLCSSTAKSEHAPKKMERDSVPDLQRWSPAGNAKRKRVR
jgi:hypothetical protein